LLDEDIFPLMDLLRQKRQLALKFLLSGFILTSPKHILISNVFIFLNVYKIISAKNTK